MVVVVVVVADAGVLEIIASRTIREVEDELDPMGFARVSGFFDGEDDRIHVAIGDNLVGEKGVTISGKCQGGGCGALSKYGAQLLGAHGNSLILVIKLGDAELVVAGNE